MNREVQAAFCRSNHILNISDINVRDSRFPVFQKFIYRFKKNISRRIFYPIISMNSSSFRKNFIPVGTRTKKHNKNERKYYRKMFHHKVPSKIILHTLLQLFRQHQLSPIFRQSQITSPDSLLRC